MRKRNRQPLAGALVALVLAFAVVCPVMAAPGVPESQGCHQEHESTPDAVVESATCCSSVIAPRPVETGPDAVSALLPVVATAEPARTASPAAAPRFRETGPPLFLRHAALLI